MIAVALAALLGLGWLGQGLAQTAEPGLVDVGGFHLYLDCRGSGSPAVVFDADLDTTLDSWGEVAPHVAATTRTCTYDRAGLGMSERGPEPRTTARSVTELRTLLRNAGVAPPYVLVGHGFGGLNALLFAETYPRETAGVVLVDATHEDWYSRVRTVLPLWVRDVYMRQLRGNFEGIDLDASAAELHAAPAPPAVPVVVLAHTYGHVVLPGGVLDQTEQLWTTLERNLAERIPTATFVEADRSGHLIQHDQPELVIDAVRDVRATALARRGSETSGAAPIPSAWIALPVVVGGLVAGLLAARRGGRGSAPASTHTPTLLLRLHAGLRGRSRGDGAPPAIST
jgi:pimeloyl-ACP methyl ester carboxylesterase